MYIYIYMYILHISWYVMVRDLARVVLGCADYAVGVLLAFFCYTQSVLDIHMQVRNIDSCRIEDWSFRQARTALCIL